MVELVEKQAVEASFCDCCGEPRRQWQRASAEGQRMALSRYCNRHTRALPGFTAMLARFVEVPSAEPAIEPSPLSVPMQIALRTLACEFCGGGSVARQISVSQQRAWLLSLTNIPSSQVSAAIGHSERSGTSAIRRVEDAIHVAAGRAGVDEHLLRNILIRSMTRPDDRVGHVGDVLLGDQSELSKAIHAARIAELEWKPEQVIKALVPPLVTIAPQRLDVPPLVWRYPHLPAAAFDVRGSLRRLQAPGSRREWQRHRPLEPLHVLEAWLASASELCASCSPGHQDHGLLNDFRTALRLMLAAVQHSARFMAEPSAVFPRRCATCGKEAVDDLERYCKEHTREGVLYGTSPPSGEDLTDFSRIVRRVEQQMLQAASLQMRGRAESWLRYRHQQEMEWHRAHRLSSDRTLPIGEQQAALEYLQSLTTKSIAAQLDVPGARIKQVLVELRRRRVSGDLLLLGLRAVDRICEQPQRPTLKQLAAQFDVTPQNISKRMPGAERQMRTVLEIGCGAWEPASPSRFEAEREPLHQRILLIAIFRWLCPPDGVATISNEDIVAAMEKLGRLA